MIMVFYRQHLRTWMCIFMVSSITSSLLQAEEKRQSIIERRMEATVCIGTVQNVKLNDSADPVDTFVPCGTGIIIGIPEDPQKRACLVTAKHVFDDPSKNWHPTIVNLRFTWNQELPLEQYHGLAIRIRQDGQIRWISHPKSDLAAVALLIPGKIVGRDTVSAVTPEELVPPEQLVVGQPVSILGFPAAVGGSLGSSFMTLPLVRRGIISWLPTSEKMPRAILVDAMAFPGNSGGPVFNEPRYWDEYGNVINKPQRMQFIGIVSKAAIQPMELKAVLLNADSPKMFKPISLDYMGLTQIEPADRVQELLAEVRKSLLNEAKREGAGVSK